MSGSQVPTLVGPLNRTHILSPHAIALCTSRFRSHHE